MKHIRPSSNIPAKPSRRFLLKGAALAPMWIAAAPLLQGCGQAEPGPTVSADDMLELGAREAVERITNGEMKAEAYVARLLQHYNAHKHLNTVITINETRVMEE